MFIARISKGRTIREFIVGVLLVPTSVAIVWMTGFGGTALYEEIYKKVEAEPKAVERELNLWPRPYLVQDLDAEHGLPLTEDGAWLVGPDAKAVAHPTGVLLKAGQDGVFLTKDGTEVQYRRGVLVHQGTRKPYQATGESRFDGPYKATEVELTLAGYLSNPILSEDRTAKVDTTATAMFVMLEALPLSKITALIGTLCIILFFVTSSDSASMVADIIASGGSEDPALGTRLFWGILEGTLAAVLLLAGGLVALQTGSITIGLPFCAIIILMCFSLARGLRCELAGEIPVEQANRAAGKTAPGKG
jgi:hypothetical protein